MSIYVCQVCGSFWPSLSLGEQHVWAAHTTDTAPPLESVERPIPTGSGPAAE